jgi:anti-sigma regulatory factor (Ser/Thr protein kinase)
VCRIRLVVESELPNVALMAMAVNRICSFYGMDETAAYQLEVCASEAATNAIVHAYGGLPGHEVTLAVSIENGSVILACADTGKSMGLEQIERVTLGRIAGEPVRNELREGGRGLEIIHEVMDEIQYTREGSSNCLKMTKRLPDAGEVRR